MSAVPTLVVAGLFDPSVSVLPLDKQAMVPCPYCLGRTAGLRGICECDGESVPFVSGPIHIAHQCPECDGEAWFDQWARDRRACPRCNPNGRLDRGMGWVYRSAQADQVPVVGIDDEDCDLTCIVVDGDRAWIDHQNEFRLTYLEGLFTPGTFALLVSGVSSETAPYLGDVTPGWHA